MAKEEYGFFQMLSDSWGMFKDRFRARSPRSDDDDDRSEPGEGVQSANNWPAPDLTVSSGDSSDSSSSSP